MKTLKGLLNLTRRSARWVFLIVVLLVLIYGYYILFIRNPYTTDAYVQGNWVQVAARVHGPVTQLYVKNNQHVKKGQPLFEIDPTLRILAVKQAQGNLTAIDQKLAALEQAIKVAEHLIDEKVARLRFAEEQIKRFKRLAIEGAVPIERYNQWQANFSALQAEQQQAVFALEKLKQELGSIITNGQRQAAIAALAIAKKRLGYSTVRATVTGTLSNFYIRKGSYIKIGEPLFSIVEDGVDWWVQANYLEFELRRIKIGQSADIVVSMYPRHVFKGKIEAIGKGISRGRNISNQNTLPVVAESINWIRLFSRFPVFIHIVKQDKKYPLRVGATAVVVVHAK